MNPIMQNHPHNFINMPININIPTVNFPAIFFDGEHEIDLGNVEITPLMHYKSFSKLISDIIGISPHQITIYLQHHQTPTQNYPLTPPSPHHHHRRHRQPVTNKFDFASLVAARSSGAAAECYFSAVLKRRTRRARHHRATQMNENNKVVLLRRENGMNAEEMMYMNRYLMSLDMNSNVYDELYNDNYNVGYDYNGSDDVDNLSSTTGSDRVYCDVCYNFPAGDAVPFHWCKNDVVTSGFRSGAGPIAPPSKN